MVWRPGDILIRLQGMVTRTHFNQLAGYGDQEGRLTQGRLTESMVTSTHLTEVTGSGDQYNFLGFTGYGDQYSQQRVW